MIGLCVIQARGGWKELSGCEVNQVGGTKVQSSSQVVRGQRSRSGSCNCRWRKINATELGAACACGDSSQSLAQGVHTSPRWCCLNTYCSTWQSSHSSPLVQSSAKEAEGAWSAISWRTSSTLRERQSKYSSSWWNISTFKGAAERYDFSVRDWKFRIVEFAFFRSRVESTIGFSHLPERDFHFYREGQFESLVSGRKERRGRGGVWVDWRGLASLGGSPAWGLLLSPDPGFFLPQNLHSPRKTQTSNERPARIIVRAAQRSRNQWQAFPLWIQIAVLQFDFFIQDAVAICICLEGQFRSSEETAFRILSATSSSTS